MYARGRRAPPSLPKLTALVPTPRLPVGGRRGDPADSKSVEMMYGGLLQALQKQEEFNRAMMDSWSGLPAPHAETHLVGKSDALQSPAAPRTVIAGGQALAGNGPSYMREDAQLIGGVAAPANPTGKVAAVGSAQTFLRSDSTTRQGIVTTKGDVLTHDGSTAERLPVGADGLALTASSAAPTGLAWAAPAAAPHNLLSTTHGDTVANAPLRGALVVGNATPAWARLALGAAGFALLSDGTDALWSALRTVLRPAQVTANQNDYSPGTLGLASTTAFVSTDASRDFTGLLATGAGDGYELLFVNDGANPAVLQHQNVGSAAGNRFLCSTGADITVPANGAARIVRDATATRWRVYLL